MSVHIVVIVAEVKAKPKEANINKINEEISTSTMVEELQEDDRFVAMEIEACNITIAIRLSIMYMNVGINLLIKDYNLIMQFVEEDSTLLTHEEETGQKNVWVLDLGASNTCVEEKNFLRSYQRMCKAMLA